MTSLSRADRHYWEPVPQITQWLCDTIPAKGRVLEIGPGHVPFPRADAFVDFMDREVPGGKTLIKIDATAERLPFEPKSFDFVYCRHVLEDCFNPFPLLKEMERVAIAGYIETPSPIAELCRGVDGGAPYYRGYHHHRFIIWEHNGELRFVAKYPLVEYLYGIIDDLDLPALLRQGPIYWNTYYRWNDAIIWKHRQNSLDFDMMRDYPMLVRDAAMSSKTATEYFWSQMPECKSEVPTLKRAFA